MWFWIFLKRQVRDDLSGDIGRIFNAAFAGKGKVSIGAHALTRGAFALSQDFQDCVSSRDFDAIGDLLRRESFQGLSQFGTQSGNVHSAEIPVIFRIWINRLVFGEYSEVLPFLQTIQDLLRFGLGANDDDTQSDRTGLAALSAHRRLGKRNTNRR